MIPCPNPDRVVMVGTSHRTHGGISAVVEAYRREGLFERWPIDYVETHVEGTWWHKAAAAIFAFFHVLVLIVRHRCAVLHVHGASRASFWRKAALMAPAIAAGWPVVFHLHGGGFAQFYERECGPSRKRIVRFFLDHAAWVVVVSERWRVWVRTITNNPRVLSLPNPVSLPPIASSARSKSLIVYCGRCESSKGIIDLLGAVAELRGRMPSVKLECAGEGDLDFIARKVVCLGLRDAVALDGWVDERERSELLARAAVFVLPSMAEGMPMSLLEAMAAGCPVVASAVGGIPDLVQDNVNGLLVPPGDRVALRAALERVLRDRALGQRLGRAARETVLRRYSADRAVERVERLYRDLGVHERPMAHVFKHSVPARTLRESS